SAAGSAAGLVGRVQAALHRRRIRMNLVSGVEFEQAVLVVAPLVAAFTGPYALVWVTAVAAALLITFEAGLWVRSWPAPRAAAWAATAPGPLPRLGPSPADLGVVQARIGHFGLDVS